MRWLRWLGPPILLLALGGWLLSRDYGLWYDELYTAEVAPRPLGTLVRAIVAGEGTIPYLRDAPPSYNGPYYLATHLWLTVTSLKADEWGLRLLSLLASAGAVAVFTAVVSRLAGAAAGLAAGLFTAANPFVVQFAAEARGYGLALLATAVAALGLARWLDDRPRALLLYGVGAGAAGLAHWFTLFVLAAFALAAMVLRGRRGLPLVAVTAVASLPPLALIAVAVANGVGASGVEWIRGVGLGAPRLVVGAWTGGSPLLLIATVLAATAGLLLRPTAETRAARIVGGLWVGVPIAMVTVLGLIRPLFVARYLLPATLGLGLLMALGITRLRHTGAVLAAGAVVAVSAAATLALVARGPTEDVRGAVAAVAAAHGPGEPVVAGARWDALGLDHYARRDHPGLVRDLVVPPAGVPPANTVWVVRRVREGVKGDRTKLAALDADLGRRGLRVTDERRFEGRASDVLVQRWDLAAQARVRTD